MLNEMRQAQKDRYCTSPYMRHPEQSGSEADSGRWLPGTGGGGEQESLLNGYGAAVMQDEEVLEIRQTTM